MEAINLVAMSREIKKASSIIVMDIDRKVPKKIKTFHWSGHKE